MSTKLADQTPAPELATLVLKPPKESTTLGAVSVLSASLEAAQALVAEAANSNLFWAKYKENIEELEAPYICGYFDYPRPHLLVMDYEAHTYTLREDGIVRPWPADLFILPDKPSR